VKHLHFAGYDFISGPNGTVINRQRGGKFSHGAKITYKDISLRNYVGTVIKCDHKWATVVWQGHTVAATEWADNLILVEQ
jgi:hypothetical protein